jgi:hypothetical protein
MRTAHLTWSAFLPYVFAWFACALLPAANLNSAAAVRLTPENQSTDAALLASPNITL